MARIAFILLTHKDAPGVIAQAERLTATGDFVSIHFDARASLADYAAIRAALRDNPRVAFAARRHKCGWGEWSLVAASLEALRTAADAFPAATHFYMLSGDCMPIKSAEYTHDFLDEEHVDYIESFDFHASDWIKTGFKEERLIYRHWFNERNQPRLFYGSYELQRRLGLKRRVPEGLRMMIGSQWWCLRRHTVEALLAFCDSRPDIVRFFRTTWIPDETFFQTLVPHLVPRGEIRRRTLTHLIFTDYGMPVEFCNDHLDMLLGQDFLFARKISPEATELKARLAAVWQSTGQQFPTSGDGQSLFRFLTARGRIGRRYGRRFWETDASIERDSRLLMVVAKKWHVAKRLTAAIRDLTPIPAVDYLFNEVDANLPDLGGVASSITKRERHRRALVRLLFKEYPDPRLVICLDPSAIELINDFADEKSETAVLFIEGAFDDDYLTGHLERVGLISRSTPPEMVERLLPAVRSDLEQEAERLRDAGLASFYRIGEGFGEAHNASALAAFLQIDHETALALARTEHLFAD